MAMTVDKQKQRIKDHVDTILTACNYEKLTVVEIDVTPGTVGLAFPMHNYRGAWVQDFLIKISYQLEDYITDITGRNFIFTSSTSTRLNFTEV